MVNNLFFLGYRDAQVGWVVVKESTEAEAKSHQKVSREALFLIIYAPRRGILEVHVSFTKYLRYLALKKYGMPQTTEVLVNFIASIKMFTGLDSTARTSCGCF